MDEPIGEGGFRSNGPFQMPFDVDICGRAYAVPEKAASPRRMTMSILATVVPIGSDVSKAVARLSVECECFIIPLFDHVSSA